MMCLVRKQGRLSWGNPSGEEGATPLCAIGIPRKQPPFPFPAAAFLIAYFSPDPCQLSGSSDCTVCLWDPKTGRRLREFLGHQSPVCGVTNEVGKLMCSLADRRGNPFQGILWQAPGSRRPSQQLPPTPSYRIACLVPSLPVFRKLAKTGSSLGGLPSDTICHPGVDGFFKSFYCLSIVYLFYTFYCFSIVVSHITFAKPP